MSDKTAAAHDARASTSAHNSATDAEIALYWRFVRDGVDEFSGELLAEVLTRLFAAEAQRDAAHTAGILEGERRATAAIVAWFMKQGENRQDAGKAIERGDHLSK